MASYPQVPRAVTPIGGGTMNNNYGVPSSRLSGAGGSASVDQSNPMPRAGSSGQLQNRGTPSPSRPLPQSMTAPGVVLPNHRQPSRLAPAASSAMLSSSFSAQSTNLSATRPYAPNPSPPTRPALAPRSSSAASPPRPSAANDPSPPDSPSSQPLHPADSVHNRFHPSAAAHSRSSSPHSDADDGYSPKRKKSVSAVTIFVFAGICFALLLFLTYVSNNYDRWAWLAAARAVSAVTILHPLLPAVSIHHPLIPPASPPPLVNLSTILAAYQTLHKRLPFHPPMDQDHTQPPPPEDTPISHPWYFPPPVTLPAILPKPYERAAIHYQTNVTPKHLRKYATPGTDPSMAVDEDSGGGGGQQADGGAAEPAGDEAGGAGEGDGVVNGVKVVAGVKVRPPMAGDDALEWTEEEREVNRRNFQNVTLNINLVNQILWRPPVQTLASATSKDWPPPVIGEEQYVFKDDFLFIIITEKKNHGLVRKIRSTWGQYVKHWLVYSDFYDSKLNTTVIKNPQPTWAPHEYKSSSWKIAAFIAHLAKHSEHHRPFYMVIDQYSFPLLDQIKWRFDHWRRIWKDQYPAFVTGRPDKRPFKFAYYTEQQQMAASLFPDQFQVVPMYGFGFDHLSLMTMSYYTPVDICPPLSEDNMSLAALIQCAGGITQEYHFLAMTRSNHREKGLTAGAALQQWRILDIYSQTRTTGMLEEAFGWYYGGLAKV